MRFNKVLKACLCDRIIARNENAVELAKKSKREAIWVRFPSGKPNQQKNARQEKQKPLAGSVNRTDIKREKSKEK